jgi:Ran GTPase-activating protein (RanGAP) involved in mRNA processing and transport
MSHHLTGYHITTKLVVEIIANTTLHHLDINRCTFASGAFEKLWRGLQRRFPMYFSITNCTLTTQNLSVIAETLRSCGDLCYLTLSFCGIQADGMAILARGLKKSRLLSLNLYGNEIRTTGAYHLAKALRSGETHFIHLDIGCNYITDTGMIAVMEAIPKSTVTRLVVDFNLLTAYGLFMVFMRADRLRLLSVGGHTFCDGVMECLFRLIQRNTQLEILNLENVGLDDRRFSQLMTHVKDHLWLQYLDVSLNGQITSTSVPTVMRSIKTHVSLQDIDLLLTRVRPDDVTLIDDKFIALHSLPAREMIALLCAYEPKQCSMFKMVPKELMRSLLKMLI